MSKVKILLVEDDRVQLEILKALIPAEKFDINIALNGKEALTLLKDDIPDIILSDLVMPEMDGKELLEHVRKNPDCRYVYFIMYSGDYSVENSAEMLNLGANDFLGKPVREQEIGARLGVACRYIDHVQSAHNEYLKMYSNIDVLLIQDGGLAPGYNAVTGFLTKYIEASGRSVFAALEGFRSLVSGHDHDFRRLIYSTDIYHKTEHIPGVLHAPVLIESAGANFRSERFKEFINMDIVKLAAANILKRNVKAIVAIGGNGTLFGIKDLAQCLPPGIQTFFIPVTVDSDVFGTETIGQHTGVEFGSEKIRSYKTDARTHKRIYIIEMMGAKGGFHALHSCLGAHAHLAVLPGFKYDYRKIVEGLNRRESAVIVVAEGYKREVNPNFDGNAAELLYDHLKATNIPINKRVVCEPFSRDIRGIPPNNVDVILSMQMAWHVAEYMKEGKSKLMPGILGEESKPMPFDEISTDNTVNQMLAKISNRLY